MLAHSLAKGGSAKNDLHRSEVRTTHQSAPDPTRNANVEPIAIVVRQSILLPCPIQMRPAKTTDATPTTIPRDRMVSTGSLDRFCLTVAIENPSLFMKGRRDAMQRDNGTLKVVAIRSGIVASLLLSSLLSNPPRRANTTCYRPFDISPLHRMHS